MDVVAIRLPGLAAVLAAAQVTIGLNPAKFLNSFLRAHVHARARKGMSIRSPPLVPSLPCPSWVDCIIATRG